VVNVWNTVSRSECLTSVVKTPEERVIELKEIFAR